MSRVFPLKGNQCGAVDPRETVWLSASAGTGKTQVLSARVLRLLLQPGVTPSQILCLTFTKAGAAEMAVRVNQVLANWVRLPETALAKDLDAIGAPFDPESLGRARTLFAAVLDCPGGGLRINTIHAFSQWLLASFPEEAGLSHGTRAMEDRDRALLARDVLSSMLLDAEVNEDHALLDALSHLSLRMQPEAITRFMLRCAAAREAWEGPGQWQSGDLKGPVKRLLGLSEDAGDADLIALCSDAALPLQSLREFMAINVRWKTKTGDGTANAIGDWLSLDAAARFAGFDLIRDVFYTGKGAVRSFGKEKKFDADCECLIVRITEHLQSIIDTMALIELAEFLAPTLVLGRTFARRWHEAKQREGFIDFDDQIREAARLLSAGGIGEWIRYKLDRRFDHILIDEAQDTNAAQWQIIDALTGEFFAGEGQRGDLLRTLFVVGDYKQAIFRFQGTSPDNFEAARDRVRDLLEGGSDSARGIRDGRAGQSLKDLDLGQSFRTARPILDFVDLAIAGIGHGQFGLNKPPEKHVGLDIDGLVALLKPVDLSEEAGAEPVESEADADTGSEGGGESGSSETWLSKPDRTLAEKIARQVAEWLDLAKPGIVLSKSGRRASAGDVMILVRRRKDIAGLIVARLHAAGVNVAGVDRLRLGAPLAVKDLVAALRFSCQPFDDLNLASLLVSPLIGWSQDDLLRHGYRGDGVRLWAHLRASSDPAVAPAVAMLLELLGKADYDPPQALLHWLLVGPWQGRARLVARLGLEANDPIDELVNAAHGYSVSDTPSLVGFLNWFDAGDGDLKRESESGGDQVRVMTVHGSKGLQAPIVILADAADDPKPGRGSDLDLRDPLQEVAGDILHAPAIPLPSLNKAERCGPILTAQAKVEKEELEEHWRLLYVAMTRAEEALFVTGALSLKEKAPAAQSWYARLAEVIDAEAVSDPIWGSRMEYGSLSQAASVMASGEDAELAAAATETVLPDWIATPAPVEPRPPKPLAPSSLGEDEAPDPPFPPGSGAAAARRGTLIHKLLERLPEVPAPDRAAVAARWLARNASELAASGHDEIAGSVLAVLGNPDWAELFSSAALPEVPIAALVGDRVVAGTIDRLLFTDGRIRLVDFKSARRPPTSLAEVPVAILRQMAAYVAALEVTYPGHEVEAALLYTQTPVLIEIPAETIAAHKPRLSLAE